METTMEGNMPAFASGSAIVLPSLMLFLVSLRAFSMTLFPAV